MPSARTRSVVGRPMAHIADQAGCCFCRSHHRDTVNSDESCNSQTGSTQQRHQPRSHIFRSSCLTVAYGVLPRCSRTPTILNRAEYHQLLLVLGCHCFLLTSASVLHYTSTWMPF